MLRMSATDCDPRVIYRLPTDASAPSATRSVGPLGSSSFSLPTVERRWQKWRTAARALMSPILGRVHHEVLHNFFKSLLNPKDSAASPVALEVSTGEAARKPRATWPMMSGNSTGATGASSSRDSQRIRMRYWAEDGYWDEPPIWRLLLMYR